MGRTGPRTDGASVSYSAADGIRSALTPESGLSVGSVGALGPRHTIAASRKGRERAAMRATSRPTSGAGRWPSRWRRGVHRLRRSGGDPAPQRPPAAPPGAGARSHARRPRRRGARRADRERRRAQRRRRGRRQARPDPDHRPYAVGRPLAEGRAPGSASCTAGSSPGTPATTSPWWRRSRGCRASCPCRRRAPPPSPAGRCGPRAAPAGSARPAPLTTQRVAVGNGPAGALATGLQPRAPSRSRPARRRGERQPAHGRRRRACRASRW